MAEPNNAAYYLKDKQMAPIWLSMFSNWASPIMFGGPSYPYDVDFVRVWVK